MKKTIHTNGVKNNAQNLKSLAEKLPDDFKNLCQKETTSADELLNWMEQVGLVDDHAIMIDKDKILQTACEVDHTIVTEPTRKPTTKEEMTRYALFCLLFHFKKEMCLRPGLIKGLVDQARLLPSNVSRAKILTPHYEHTR